jgi:phage tail protein X
VTRSFTGGNATDTVSIAVKLTGPTSLNYTSNTPTYGRNVAITANTVTVSGGTEGLSYAVQSGALPAGLSLHASTGAISGLPTASGVFTPTIRVSNDSGFADQTLTITVNGFAYATASPTYGKRQTISANNVSGITGTGGTYSVSPVLPTGLSLNTTSGTISGEPSVQSAQTKYAILRTFTGGSAIDTLILTVNGFTYSTTSATYGQNETIPANTPGSEVGAGGTYSVSPSLPSGLVLDANTGVITGTPTVSQASSKYAVIRNFAGASAVDTLLIAVGQTGPVSLDYFLNTPTYGKNVAIVANVATVVGGSEGLVYAVQSGSLPAGLTLNTSTGTISGKPTSSGVFTPVIRVSNDSGFADRSLTITVNGFFYTTSSAVYGKNLAITANTIAGSTGSDGTYSGTLPSGLSLDPVTGSISGTPTAQLGTAKFAISRNFTDATALDTLTITVNGFSYVIASTTYGQNTAIATNSPASIVGAGGTFTVFPSLPVGLSLNASTGDISGTPSATQSATKYAVTRTFTGGSSTDTVSIAVKLAAPTSVNYASNTPTYGRNVAITANTAAVDGGTESLTYAVQSGALPTGLSLNASTGAISGLPTASGVFTPTIRVSNDSGFADRTLTITVNGFAYATASPTYGKNQLVSTNTATGITGAGGTYSVSPSLPSGLSLNTSTGVISGTPSAQLALAKYAVTRDFAGASAIDTVFITVNGFTYSVPSVTYGQNTAIATNSPASIVGAGGTYAVSPSLPSGLSLNASTGDITGTPTVTQAAAKYAVTRSFTDGSATDTISIALGITAPSSLNYASNSPTYGRNVAITPNTGTVGGGTENLTYTVQSGTLPTGLSLHASTGAISGLPTASGVFTPTIRVSNDSGFADRALTITVNGFSYTTSTPTYGKNQAITSNAVTGITGTGGSYSVSPALPSALSLNTSTGAISGTPSAQGASAKYAVTRDFTGGSAIDTVSITVNGFTYSVASATYSQNTAMATNSPVSLVGAGGTYSVSPSLPSGLSLNASTGDISGTPTATQSVTKYAVTRSFTDGSATDTVSIAVKLSAPSSLNYAANAPTYGKNVAISNNSVAVGGGTEALAYSVQSGALPIGLSLNAVTGAISGLPTASGVFTPTIRVSNDSGFADRALTITVNGFAYTTPAPTYGKNQVITSNMVTGVTGTGGTYSVSPSLPSGLSLNTSTGAISGTPSAQVASAKYAVMRDFNGASAIDTVSITINGFSYVVALATYGQNAAVATNSPASIVGAGGTYAVSPSLPSGLTLNASTGAITGTPTATQFATKYAVTRSFTGGSASDTLSIAVKVSGPTSLNYASNAPTYGRSVTIASNTVTVEGGTEGLSYAVQSGSLPSGLSLSASTGAISGLPTMSGVFTPTIRVSNDSGFADRALTITVNGFSYTNASPAYGKNQAITANAVTGITGTGGSFSVFPSLPAGLSLNTSTGAISGTPSAQVASAKYAVTRDFIGASAVDTLSITINGFSYSVASVTYGQNVAISTNGPISIVGVGGSYTVSPSLPSGLSLNASTGEITGTPTATQLSAKYAVTRSFSGASATDTVSIMVQLTPPAFSYVVDSIHATVGTTVSSVAPLSTGGTIATYAIIPNLESLTGLFFNTATGLLSGTPTNASTATSYAVVATNAAGADTSMLVVSVRAAKPEIAYAPPPSYKIGSAIASLPPTLSGGPVDSFSVSPSIAGNTGLTLNNSTGVVSGTPTVLSLATSYRIVAAGPGGLDTALLIIEVQNQAVPRIAYADSRVFSKGLAITALVPDTTGSGPIDSVTVSPALPAGLVLNKNTGAISGMPSAVSALASYVLTARGQGGEASDTLQLTVHDIAPVIAYSDSQAYVVGTTGVTLSPASAGGTVITYSINPDLFANTGLTFNTANGVISGTPTTAAATTPYSIIASNSGGADTAVFFVTVKAAKPEIAYATPQPFVALTGISDLSPSSLGGPVTGYTGLDALPVGLSMNGTSGVISGTPSAVTASAVYRIRAFGPGGADTAFIALTVNPAVPAIAYATDSLVLVLGAPVLQTPASTGGDVATYFISPSLSANTGLTFNASTGVVSGIPTFLSASTDYTVIATNLTGADTVVLKVSVVAGIPGAPTAVVAVAQDASVLVSFTAPSTTGGAPVSVYTVTAWPGGASVSGSASPMRVTGLLNGVSYRFTVTATNVSGTGAASDTSNSVTPNARPEVSYASPSVFVVGTTITPVFPVSSAGPVSTYSILGGGLLPAGFILDGSTGMISGTPTTASAAAQYAILATGPGGLDTALVTLGVNAAVPVVAYASAPTLVAGTTIAPISIVSSAGPVTGYSILGASLPAGLALNTSTGAITGTPTTATSVATYSILATGPGGLDTATIALTVNAAVPVVTYPLAPDMALGTTIVPIQPIVSGGPVTTYSVLGTPLPVGLSLNASTGVISGTPTVATVTESYSILVSGPGGLDTAGVNLVVHAPPSVTYTTQDPFVVGTAITPMDPISSGGAVSGFSLIGPPLPAGLALDPVTGTISGTPTAEATTTLYQVLVIGPGGLDTAFVVVRVDPVGILPGAFVFRVSGSDQPYTFQLPAGATETEQVTMIISDVRGTTLWSNTIHPTRDPREREIIWTGRASNGCKASAGMHVVRLAVTQNGQTTRYIRKAVTLKPGR